MNYYAHHIGDFDRATRHLTRTERSIYRDLIELYYDTERALPSDVALLCRKVLARSEEEVQAVTQVLGEFFTATDTGWQHARCEAELDKYRRIGAERHRASMAAKAKREGKAGGVPPVDDRTLPLFPDDGSAPPPKCPHEAIIALYHEVLPMCPRVVRWTDARQALLRTRWNEDVRHQSLDFWRDFFGYVGDSAFLTGRVTGKGAKPFLADLEWIVRPANFVKIIEGKYSND